MLSYEDRQERWVKENCVEEGTILRVCFKVPSKELGFSKDWTPAMDAFVGKELPLETDGTGYGLPLTFDRKTFWFPYYCLNVVKEEEKEEIRRHSESFKEVVGKMFQGSYTTNEMEIVQVIIETAAEVETIREEVKTLREELGYIREEL